MVLGIVEYGTVGEVIVLALEGMVVLPLVVGEVVWMIRRNEIEIELTEGNEKGIETVSTEEREKEVGETGIGKGRGKERETEIGNGNAKERGRESPVNENPEIGAENMAGGSPVVWTCLRCQ